MSTQAEYFRVHPDSPYVMIADNIRHPFNEYLKLTVQYGLVGLSFAIVILVFVVQKLLKCSEEDKLLGLSFITSVVVICQFSYPFNYHVVWLFSIIVIFPVFISQTFVTRIPRLFRFTIIPLLLFFLFNSTKNMYYEMKLKEVIVRSLSGKSRRMINNFKDVDRIMGDNPVFKYNYAVLLNDIGRYEESLAQVSVSEMKLNEYSTQMLFADNYNNLDNKEKAILAYEEAHNMVPCRFEPIYGKLMAYYELGDTTNIIRTAYEIIEKPKKFNLNVFHKSNHKQIGQ